MSAIPTPGLGGHDSIAAIRDLDRHYGELSDSADSAAARSRAAVDADQRTAPARFAIKALAKGLTEAEACALVACLQDAIRLSGWGHTTSGEAARESLTDAHWAIEQGESL